MPRKNTKNTELLNIGIDNQDNNNDKRRKPRKQNEKEILRAYHIETKELDIDIQPLESPDNINPNKKKEKDNKEKDNKEKEKDKKEYTKQNYENFAYLSPKERAAFEKKFTVPKNIHQEMYCKLLKTKSKKIVIANGPAGTGKTLFATEYGVRYFLTDTYEKLIFTRPSVSVDEELGFLPGTLEEKMAPWVRPIYDVLYNFLSPKEVQQLMEDKIIEIAPLGYMRGRTFKNAWIVADEMQNSTVSQMKMLLTRLGENSRLVVTGDLQQFDRSFENNGLDDFLRKLRFKEQMEKEKEQKEQIEKKITTEEDTNDNSNNRNKKSIVSFEFLKGDIQREEVVKEVLDIYEYIH